ncbi:solute carrier family 66 member 2 [Bombina bombina]|uniref:solute carrier family 66 member 2 n=1 Tax=Bombina bombina TaxID=8345 RepID=UPI00235A61BA|nr:solute carrier family 66 member 2 [Bombina bombina]
MDAPENSDEAWSVLSWIASSFIIFGGAIPYIPQYQEIKRTSNADGFSTWVCFVLIVANIFRILFWFGKYFEFPLLLQSILMIITMLTMLNLCCSVQTLNRVATRQYNFTDLSLQYFWKWSRFEDYVQFCFVLATSGFIITYVYLDTSFYVEGIGMVALLTEAMLGVPQFLQNYKNCSTRGMSVKMVLMWTAGDLLKTCYFIIKDTPLQFWLCGMLQVCFDIAILFQVYYYNQKPHPKYG